MAKRVLITSIGTATGICVIKALRKDPTIYIVGCDINTPNRIAGSSMCDEFYSVPFVTDKDAYINRLLEICNYEKIDVIFPLMDSEVELLSLMKNKFQAKIWVSSFDTVETCNDKYKMSLFCYANGFPHPQTSIVINKDKINSFMFKFPLMVKPRGGVGSAGIFKVDSFDELRITLDKVSHAILQEYIEGDEYTIDIVFDEDFGILGWVTRLRLETKAGVSYKGMTVKSNISTDWALELAKKLKIVGPCNVQVKGEKIIEVNPRFSGGLSLSVEAGMNSPLMLVKLSQGEIVEPVKNINEHLVMCRYWEEVFYGG